MRFVPTKTVEQLDLQALHRVRSRLVSQRVRDHHARGHALLLDEFPQQALGSFGIAPALNYDVEHGPALVDSASQPVLPARNADRNLV